MKSRSTMVVEIMDTTLRDGEQTSGYRSPDRKN